MNEVKNHGTNSCKKSTMFDSVCRGLFSLSMAFLTVATSETANAQFDNVINSPPTVIGNFFELESNTQLNVFEGGLVGGGLDVGSRTGDSSNVELNVMGGEIGLFMRVNDGGTANIFGGEIGPFVVVGSLGELNISDGNFMGGMTIETNGEVSISGGRFGDSAGNASIGLSALDATLNISGGVFGDEIGVGTISGGTATSEIIMQGSDFKIDGLPIDIDNPIDLAENQNFTMTLSDGSPFFASTEDSDRLINLSLIATDVPPVTASEITIDGETADIPSGLRSGQTLNLLADGTLPVNFTAIESILNIQGGNVGLNFDVVNSELNQTGGRVERNCSVFGNSVANLSGGVQEDITIGNKAIANVNGATVDTLIANSGSTINLMAGWGTIEANAGSLVTMTDGGPFAIEFESGSTGQINGGFIAGLDVATGSDVTLQGGEFLLNGLPLDDPSIASLNDQDSVLTGTLEDGSVFILPGITNDINSLQLDSTSVPTNNQEQFFINDAQDIAPENLRAGQSLTLTGQGALPNNLVAANADINITGGTAETIRSAFSTIFVSGGSTDAIRGYQGTSVTMVAGDVAWNLVAPGCSFDICGGSVSQLLFVTPGGTAEISGGEFPGIVTLQSNGAINLSGTEFSVDGRPIDGLVKDVPMLITQRDVQLSGTLADGSSFKFFLAPAQITDPFPMFNSSFDPNAALTVTLTDLFVLGDVNEDGVLDLLDIAPFVNALGGETFVARADTNKDGVVDLLDVGVFVSLLAGD